MGTRDAQNGRPERVARDGDTRRGAIRGRGPSEKLARYIRGFPVALSYHRRRRPLSDTRASIP